VKKLISRATKKISD